MVDRLTDTTGYTGIHKNRFDDDGKGRGADGRDVGSKGRGTQKPLFRLDKGDKIVKDLSEITRPGVNSYRPPPKKAGKPKKLRPGLADGAPVVVARGEKKTGDQHAEMRETTVLSAKRQCHACGKAIQNQGYDYEGNFYHHTCLRCCMCERTFPQGQGIYPRDGETFCKVCYAKRYNAKCNGCRKYITEGSIVSVDHPEDGVEKIQFHRDCFRCAECDKSLLSGHYAVAEDGSDPPPVTCTACYNAAQQRAEEDEKDE